MTVRGHVTNGRLVVDVPTDLPEGSEVELVTVGDVVERHQVADDHEGRSVIDAAGARHHESAQWRALVGARLEPDRAEPLDERVVGAERRHVDDAVDVGGTILDSSTFH